MSEMSGDIIGSCGHSVADLFTEGRTAIITASQAKDGTRVAAYHTACLACQRAIRDAGCELQPDEVDGWLAGTLKANVW